MPAVVEKSSFARDTWHSHAIGRQHAIGTDSLEPRQDAAEAVVKQRLDLGWQTLYRNYCDSMRRRNNVVLGFNEVLFLDLRGIREKNKRSINRRDTSRAVHITSLP